MLSLRLDTELEDYLKSRSKNKSEYVRTLIEQDKKKNQKIDPKKEYRKCKDDLLYFVSKYCYIKHQSKGKVLFEPYDYQKEILMELEKNNSLMIVKGRQLGITTTLALYSLWKTLFTDNQNAGYISMKREQAKMFITDKMFFSLNNLPDWLRKPLLLNNRVQLEFQNNSKVQEIPQSPHKGETYNLSVIDEASFIDKLGDKWSRIYPMIDENSGQVIIVTNGILKDNKNYQVLKELYKNNWLKNIECSYLDHPDRDKDWRNEKISSGYYTREKFLAENGALVEVENE